MRNTVGIMTTQTPRAGRFRWVTLVTLVTVGLMALLPAQAAAAAGAIQVSDDGVTFGTVYPGVLFDGVATIVPGDTQTEVFYVRNTGPDDGYLRITLRDVAGNPVLLQNLSVSADVASQPGVAASLVQGAPCWVLNEGILLPAGTTIAVTADLTFDFAAGNITQVAIATFDVGLSLTDTAVVLAPTDCGGASTVLSGTVPKLGELSHTGGEVPVMLISVTAFIVGAGLFLILAARRRKREHDDTTPSE